MTQQILEHHYVTKKTEVMSSITISDSKDDAAESFTNMPANLKTVSHSDWKMFLIPSSVGAKKNATAHCCTHTKAMLKIPKLQ